MSSDQDFWALLYSEGVTVDDVNKYISKNGIGRLEVAHPKTGFFPIHNAAFFGRGDVIKILLELGQPDQHMRHTLNEDKSTPLHLAAANGHLDAIKILLDAGAPPNAKDSWGRTPLVELAFSNPDSTGAEHRAANIAVYLVSRGATLGATDKKLRNSLHYAATQGNEELVQVLLTMGLDPNLKDHKGFNAYQLALSLNRQTVIEQLHLVTTNRRDVVSRSGLAGLRGGKDLAGRLGHLLAMVITILILGGAPVLYYDFVFYYFPYTTAFIVLHFGFVSANLLAFTFMVEMTMSTPGYQKRNTTEYMDELKRRLTEAGHGPRVTKSSWDTQINLCHTCRLVRPERTSHCRACGRCIRMFDHHCGFLGICVGESNLRVHLYLVISLFLTSLFGFIIFLLASRRIGFSLATFVGIGSLLGFSGLFLWNLLYSAAYGLTLHEIVKLTRAGKFPLTRRWSLANIIKFYWNLKPGQMNTLKTLNFSQTTSSIGFEPPSTSSVMFHRVRN